jgi:branched-chain amino acid transport system permease protein
MSLPSGIFNGSYSQDMAIFRTRFQRIMLAIFLVVVITCPFYAGYYMLTILTMLLITIISVHGLNILTGYCGQISMGHAGFMAVGGYTSALLCAKLGVSFWLALPAAGLAAGLIGILFGLPSLKIKGFYLIMATIAAQYIIIWVIIKLRPITGGVDGMSVPRPELFGFKFASQESFYFLVLFFTCLATYIAKNITRTRVGRAFIAIRDNDLAAEVMGVNLWKYKLLAFFIGCVFAGVAGSLTVHYYSYATPDQFPFMNSVWYLGMLIVGGIGSNSGVIFGPVFLRILDEFAITLGPMLTFINPQAAAALALILNGAVIILFLIFEPKGLAHRWEMMKTYVRIWPFAH